MASPLPQRSPAALGGAASLALFAASLAWMLSFSRHGVNWIDEGFALNAAQRVADGDTLYRDFFAPYGPGRHQLLGLLFRLFGNDLLVARGLWLALAAATAVLIQRVGTRVMSGLASSVAAGLFVLAPMQAYKVFSPGGYLIICLMILRAREAATAGRWAAAGLVTGIAGLFRFELFGAGALLLAVGALLPVPEDDRPSRPLRLGAAAAGVAAVALLFAASLAARGMLGDVLRYERMQKEQLARYFTLPLPSPLSASGAGAIFDALAAWAPAALCLVAAVLALRALTRGTAPEDNAVPSGGRDEGGGIAPPADRGALGRDDAAQPGRAAAAGGGVAPSVRGAGGGGAAALLLLAVAGSLMHIAYLGRADFDHLLHVMPVAWLLLLAGIDRLRGARAAGRIAAAAGAAFVVAFVASAIVRHPAAGHSIGRLRVDVERVETPRGVYFDTPYQAAVTRGMMQFAAAHERDVGPRRDRIAFLKFGGYWYWLLGLRSPVPQEPLSTFSADPRGLADEDAIVASLRAVDIRWVLLEEPPAAVAVLPPFAAIHPRLGAFLDSEFERTPGRIGEWTILRRR